MKIKFKNGKIRVMQVSDPQDLQFVRPTMIRMLNKAYDTLNPDLIVLTGDNILGNHLCDARIGSRLVIKDKEGEAKAMEIAIDKLVTPIEERKIPFAMIYGNHDDMNRLTKDEQADMYRKYSTCLGLDDETSPDVATYNLPIYSEDGEKVKLDAGDSIYYVGKMYIPSDYEWSINLKMIDFDLTADYTLNFVQQTNE